MKNFYVRLSQAPLNAPMPNTPGISTDNSFSTIQSEKKIRRMPLLAILLLLLPFAGMAQTYHFALNGANVLVPNTSIGTGTGTVIINTTANTMRVMLNFSGLMGITTSAHLHATTALPNAGNAVAASPIPLFTGFPLSTTSGTYDQTYDMTIASSYNPAFISANGGTVATAFTALQTALADKKAYFDIHTNIFPGGEIRAFPSSNITLTFNKTNPTCSNSTDGGVRAVPSATCSSGYQFLWTPGGATTDTISNLAPGTYNVRVVCGTDTLNSSVTLTASTFVPTPTTAGNLVIYTGSKTLNQLDVTTLAGGTVNYYTSFTGGTALPGSTLVSDDSTYYISQSVNGCESAARKIIKVNRIANDSAVYCGTATVARLTATPVPGHTAKWFELPAGGTALANTGALQPGLDTLYVTEGSSGTDTLVRRNGSAVDFIDAITHDENDSLYFATFGTNKVYSASPDGSVVRELFTSFGSPRSVYYKKEGANRFLYYLEDGSTGVRKRNLATGVTTTIGSGLFWASQMSFDDANGVIYVADRENSKVKKIVVATNTVTVVDSLITIPFVSYNRIFGVAYNAATNTIFFNNFDKGKIYSKNLSGNNAAVEILAISVPWTISLLPNDKLMIACASGIIYTCNQDGSNLVVLKNGLSSTTDPFYNTNGELTFYHANTICKETVSQSNRVPVTVIVNPTPDVTATDDKVVCNNSTQSAVNFSTTTTGAAVTYNWTNNNIDIGLAASGSGDLPSFTAVNNGTTPDTAIITVTPTIGNAGVSCVGVTDTFLIIVNPTPVVNTIADNVLCNGTPVASLTPGTTATGGSILYVWANDNTAIGLAGGGTGNIPAFTAVNNSTSPLTAQIDVRAIYSNGGTSCSGPRDTFLITVNPTVTVNAISNQVLCNNSATAAINFSSPAIGGTVTYNWTNTNTTIGLATGGSGNIPSFNATNNTTAPQVATITVTPTFINDGVSCIGTVTQFTLTVNPTATVTAISNKVVCNGTVVPSVTPESTATGGTVSYSWTNSNTAIGLAAGGTGNVPGFTSTNTTTAPLVATVTVTPTFTNGGTSCTGTPVSYTITVNPPAVFNAITDQVACNGSLTAAVPFTTTLTGGVSAFTWTNSNTATGIAASGTSNLPAFTATNTSNAPISSIISVLMTYTNAGLSCTSSSQTFTYLVNPTAKLNPVNNQTVCNRALTAPVNFSSPTSGGTIVYNWVNNTPGIGLAASGTGNIPAFTAVNNTGSVINATVTATPTFTNAGISCTGTTATFTITVNPTPVTNFTVNNAAQCITGNQFVFTNTSTGAAGYTWNLGDGRTATTVNLTHTYTNHGSYTVKLAGVTAFGCSDSITKTVTVYPQPQKPVVVPEFGNGIHSSVIANSYAWFNNNTALSNSNSQYYTPAAPGYHQVQVTNINGCTEKSDSLYYIPESNSTTGLDGQLVFVYPTPVTNGIVNIHFNVPLQHKVLCRFYSALGQLLQTVEIPAGTRQYQLDVSKYSKDNYLIRFDDFYKIKRGLIVPIVN